MSINYAEKNKISRAIRKINKGINLITAPCDDCDCGEGEECEICNINKPVEALFEAIEILRSVCPKS